MQRRDNAAGIADGSTDAATAEGGKALADAAQQAQEWHRHFSDNLHDVEPPEAAYTLLHMKHRARYYQAAS